MVSKYRVSLAVLAVLSIFIGGVETVADLTDPGSGQPNIPQSSVALPNPFTSSSLPPQFNNAAASQLAAKFSSCSASAGALGLLSGLTGNKKTSRGSSVSGGSSLTDQCTADGKAIGDDPGKLETDNCGLLQTNGVYDPRLLKAQEDEIETMSGILNCKQNKLKQAKGQIDCLTVQANQITRQINSLNQTVTQSIHKMQSDVGSLNSQSKNRASQIADVNNKLGGNKDTGATGLMGLQTATRSLVAQMQTSIQNLKEAQNTATLQRQSLVELAQQRTMGLAKDCFTTATQAQFRCYTPGTANNPAMSAEQYLVCRYRQNISSLGNNGVVEQNATMTALGNQKADQLQSLLDQIFTGSPDSNQLTQDPKQFQQNIDKVVTVFSVADVERLYGAQLSQFDAKGIPVHDYVMKYMGSCFQQATVEVQNERTRTNSTLSQQEQKVLALERANSVQISAALTAMATQYGDNMKGLTGDHLPLDTSQCNAAAPNVQANCLDQAYTNLNAQLTGVTPTAQPNTPAYSMNIFIQGNDPSTSITVNCVGLDGCVTRLQSYSTALTREQQKIDSFKTDYISKAYQNTEQFVQQLAQALSPQSEALKNQLKTMNAALSNLGVTDLVKIDDVQGEQLQADDGEQYKGLPKIPTSMLNLVGGKMQPPLINVAGDNFSSALSGIAKATTELQGKENNVTQYKIKLVAMAGRCRKEDLSKDLDAIKAQAQTYATCGRFYCYRADKQDGGFSALAGLMEKIPGISGISSVTGYLDNGNSTCSDANTDYTKANRDATSVCQDADTYCANPTQITQIVNGNSVQISDPQAPTNCSNKRKACSDAEDKLKLTASDKGQDCNAIQADIRNKIDKLDQEARSVASDAQSAP